MEALVLWDCVWNSRRNQFIKEVTDLSLKGFLWGFLLSVIGLIVTIAKPSLKEN